MSTNTWALLIIGLITFAVSFIGIKIVIAKLRQLHLLKQAKNLRFLLVKIPRKASEMDQRNDNIQSMKQNIEIMNQIYKNVYSLISHNFKEKLLWFPYVSLELLVEGEVIKFILGVPKDHLETFEKLISSFYPWSVVEQISPPQILEQGKYGDGGYFVFSKDNAYPIKTYDNFEADPMDSVLSAFSRVDRDEKLHMQILVRPLSEEWQKELRWDIKKIKKKRKWLLQAIWWLFHIEQDKEDKPQEDSSHLSQAQIWDIEKKAEDEGFEFVIRALAISPDPFRPSRIINDLKRAFYQYNYVGLNSFFFIRAADFAQFAKKHVMRFFSRPRWHPKLMLITSQIMNIKELSSIYHFPHYKFNKNPRILWQKFKIVPAPENIPTEWLLLWHNLYWGVKKEIRIKKQDRFRHFYVIGQTGTGKSSMLLVQMKQDLINGEGFALIDPHGDLAENLLKYFPKERVDDLIYFDAWDTSSPIGFNVLEAETADEKDMVINDLVETFVQMYGPEIFWPRIQDYFRNGVMLLMAQPEGGTLVELVRVFVDESYRAYLLKNAKDLDPSVRLWFEKTFAAMGDREKKEIIPYFQSKFGPFITTPIIRNILGQPKSSFDLFEVMQKGRVLILNLSKGRMGELSSALLGSMMVTHLKLVALRRASLPEEKRTPFFLYIDEFQNFVNPSIETILSEARKYKLALILAHQYIDQLVKRTLWGEVDLRPAVFGNIGTQMAYKIGAKDAEYLEQEFAPEFSREDLVNMDRFKGVIKLAIDSQPTRPFSISVLNPYTPALNSPEKIKIIKEISRLKWWRPRDLVEKEIYYRIGV